MNSKDPRYWLRDYTDDELDRALDNARSNLQLIAAQLKIDSSHFETRVKWQFAKLWFNALVDETAERWRLFDAHSKKHVRQ